MNMFARICAVFLVLLFASFFIGSLFAQLSLAQSTPTDKDIERAAASIAIVLVGDGDGLVIKVAPAVAIKAAGVFLVPYHVVRDAKEVQVRLKSGEIFDDVYLRGFDERRDIAALKVQASDIPVTASEAPDEVKPGDSVALFTAIPGKIWATSKGKAVAVRLADEVPGAGEGFRGIQFDAPIEAGTDGGILVGSNGVPVGIVTATFLAAAKSGFAVPIGGVFGLGNAGSSRTFGKGIALKLPTSEAAFKASKTPNDPANLLLKSKTVYVETNTTFFKEQQLINELNKRKEIKEWGWTFLTGSWDSRNQADLIIELDHQILSFDFTFTVRHRKTSILISAGKAIISDGASGAPKMADKIIKSISEILNPSKPKGK